MVVGYIAIGAITGLMASVLVLLAGHTLWTALFVYMLAGLLGTGLGILTAMFPSISHKRAMDGQPDPQHSGKG
jgi:hypothetical protein